MSSAGTVLLTPKETATSPHFICYVLSSDANGLELHKTLEVLLGFSTLAFADTVLGGIFRGKRSAWPSGGRGSDGWPKPFDSSVISTTIESGSPEDNLGFDCCRNLLCSTAFFPAHVASKHVTPTAEEEEENFQTRSGFLIA